MTTLSPVFHAHRQEPAEGARKWEYLVAPLQEVKALRKADEAWAPDRLNELGAQGWEAIGFSPTHSDFIASPVVLLRRALR